MTMKRSSSKIVFLFLALGTLALGGGYWLHRNSAAKSPPENSTSTPTEGQAAPEPELQEVSAATISTQQAVIHATSRATAPTAAAQPRAEATPQTRQLVSALTTLDPNGPVTRERAEQWKQTLQALVGQGATAVPAIREFLELNQEMNFAAVSGGELLGQSSLRAALINALTQIGSPDAIDLMLQTLQGTTLPSEIALIAKNLDQLSPGQYRQQTLTALNDVLGMASRGQLSGFDVAPLFQLFEGYDDPAAAAALEQLQGRYKYYSMLALASMDSGEGLPALIRQVQNPAGGSDFAYQMLAQIAAQHPDAGSTLLEQAKFNRISDSNWRKILSGLAGDQYQLGSPPGQPGQTSSQPGLKTYHIANGNQNFYSMPITADAHIAQRITLIDQLLQVTSTPWVLEQLRTARGNLGALVQPRS
jgi:hypothetical protein